MLYRPRCVHEFCEDALWTDWRPGWVRQWRKRRLPYNRGSTSSTRVFSTGRSLRRYFLPLRSILRERISNNTAKKNPARCYNYRSASGRDRIRKVEENSLLCHSIEPLIVERRECGNQGEFEGLLSTQNILCQYPPGTLVSTNVFQLDNLIDDITQLSTIIHHLMCYAVGDEHVS